MKRQNFLFERIVDFNNIRLAFLKAVRGNRKSPATINYCGNIDKNLAVLREKLITLNCGWGNYYSFTITDPKLRVISTAPFEQRIMHHAIWKDISNGKPESVFFVIVNYFANSSHGGTEEHGGFCPKIQS